MGEISIPEKSPWKSKTIITNALLGLIAFLAIFFPDAPVLESIKKFLEGNGAEAAIIWSMINVVLRLITKGKVVIGG